MDKIKKKKKALGIETAGERGQGEGFMSSNIQRLASRAQPSGLLEPRVVETPLRPPVARLETSFHVSESYVFIFALGDDV